MTNSKIIFTESLKLMNNGIIGTTGRKLTMVAEDGTKSIIDEPEQIHTFAEWKRLGYFVNKGEKAIARFAIWNFTNKPSKKAIKEAEAEGKEAVENPHYYMKEACFFTISQTSAAVKMLPAVI